MAEVNAILQLRHDTGDNWDGNDPVLLAGEIGINTDSNLIKIGNGTSTQSELQYINQFDDAIFTRNDNGGQITLTDTAAVGHLNTTTLASDATTKADALPLIAINSSDNSVINTGTTIADLKALIGTGSGTSGTTAIATNTTLGLVKGSDATNGVTVSSDGTMAVGSVSVAKLVNDESETLVLNCGGA